MLALDHRRANRYRQYDGFAAPERVANQHFPAVRAIAVVIAFCAALAPAAVGQDRDVKEYQTALNAGDLAKAGEIGARIVSGLKGRHPNSAAVPSMENRVATATNIQAITQQKMDLIRSGVAGGSPSPFRHVSPKPSELYKLAQDGIRKSQLSVADLTAEEASLARSYVDAMARLADTAVEGSYEKIMSSKPGKDDAAEARGYLTAYIIGAHDEGTLPAALLLVAKRLTDSRMPVFLVDDSVTVLKDSHAAYQALSALCAVKWASWPSGEKVRLLKAVAELAEGNQDYEIASLEYSRVVAEGDALQAEAAQAAIVKVLGEKSKNYAAAAQACAQYLKRFRGGSEALNVEYLKGRYEYEARDFNAALADIESFLGRHAESDLVPSALVYKGLVYAGQEKTDEACKVFADVVSRYPEHTLVVKARFLTGMAYFSAQRYSEATKAFQSVIDFNPDSIEAGQAAQYVDTIRKMSADGFR